MKDHLNHPHHTKSDDTLGGLLARCGHYLSHHFDSRKGGQDGILAVISQNPGITQKELAEALDIQPASVSELLMKLERKGLVLREKDEADRRSTRVRLTEDGQAHLSAPKEETDPFEGLSPEEQAQLRSLLEKLLNGWQQNHSAGRNRHGHHKLDKENHHGKHQ